MSESPSVKHAVKNQFDAPEKELPLPEGPDVITRNAIALNSLNPDPRSKLIFDNLIRHLHEFVRETQLTTDEWMTAIQFLTATGQTCTPIRQEFILLSDVLGVSALVDALNNPTVGNSTQSTVLGPFFTEDAADLTSGDSIASEGKGSYLYVTGRVVDTAGRPIPNATIETWETDDHGFYDTQYADRDHPDCRGRLKSDVNGAYAFRAVVPVAYPIPGDGPVGQLLEKMHRHNMRPAHLHMMVEAEGFQKLITSFYPEGDKWIASDAVFGVKKSLVVKLRTVDDENEARSKGFAKGSTFKLLEQDIVLASPEETQRARESLSKA
ncbi:aromatic compound dioxygenase [Sistotremastrum suecicum HHB10207 ss-3]|uniref:Aromatic compound dioxygenase n=1 Tax=Sistotremastrum suecicum HHB10207 ss-3 TaxID=1314776 RepID=A0A166BDF9_9AGAM|nr:aromatic compound dioxygenase [Sistotremastrum suecicum HHB10207 ss-3]